MNHKKAIWVDEASTTHEWVVRCKSKKGAEEIRSFELSGKEIFFNYNETKSKEEKNKKNGSKNKALRGQSVRYRSCWKQGNIKMAMSEDHASCWVHKGLTVTAVKRGSCRIFGDASFTMLSGKGRGT